MKKLNRSKKLQLLWIFFVLIGFSITIVILTVENMVRSELDDKCSTPFWRSTRDEYQKQSFNRFVSELISERRLVPDLREGLCKKPVKQKGLLKTSVIICFRNEENTVLKRTLRSVLDRSPPSLLEEIVLVDDASDMYHLKKPLDYFVNDIPKVRLIRSDRRRGIIGCRMLGARAAKAPVLTFLDSRSECAAGWLEPLMEALNRKQNVIVSPVIDKIDPNSFEYQWKKTSDLMVGSFTWSMVFKWRPIPERVFKNREPTSPLPSPAIGEGIYSIKKDLFDRLGGYDDGMDGWGGEDLEMSFKTWMCGGSIEIIPCSHVGLVGYPKSSCDTAYTRNKVRAALVWMDDFANNYFVRIGHNVEPYGNITSRLKLRKDLNCKPFKWYLDNIVPEMIPDDHLFGEVRNPATGLCLDSTGETVWKPVDLRPCHLKGGDQFWSLSKRGELRRDMTCLMVFDGSDATVYPCNGTLGEQVWEYQHQSRLLKHLDTGKCLGISDNKQYLELVNCDYSSDLQLWIFSHTK